MLEWLLQKHVLHYYKMVCVRSAVVNNAALHRNQRCSTSKQHKHLNLSLNQFIHRTFDPISFVTQKALDWWRCCRKSSYCFQTRMCRNCPHTIFDDIPCHTGACPLWMLCIFHSRQKSLQDTTYAFEFSFLHILDVENVPFSFSHIFVWSNPILPHS